MRTEFLRVGTRRQATEAAPWAAVIIKVEGGYLAFESVDDAATWRAQR